MNNLFECKVKYELLNEKDKFISVTRTFIVNALNQSEAERRIFEGVIEMCLYDNAHIKSVRELKNTEILHDKSL